MKDNNDIFLEGSEGTGNRQISTRLTITSHILVLSLPSLVSFGYILGNQSTGILVVDLKSQGVGGQIRYRH